ncbi:MAG: diaminopimelate epimerase [Phycisphaerales bacterium]|nr:diaminopimelate epimerase [Planctomycetota bacterium]MBL6997383.1 diaminopimelate epimerase [Phycisphaerales bacterium]
MSCLQKVKMHGASNQFLLLFADDTLEKNLNNLQGLDGLLLVQEDDQADAFMRVFNADGSEAEQCGNGLRCVALHLVRNKMVDSPDLTIRTLSGISHCKVSEECNEVSVTLCKPKIEEHFVAEFPNLFFVDIGNPNAVYWTEKDPLEVRGELGEIISMHKSFPSGMNVHFARRDATQNATCASYERGVGATHASGTGGASVFVAAGAGGLFYVSSQGGTLNYQLNDNGVIVMTGPACYV